MPTTSPVVDSGTRRRFVLCIDWFKTTVGKKFSPTVIAAAITSQKENPNCPTHIELDSAHCGLSRDSGGAAGSRSAPLTSAVA